MTATDEFLGEPMKYLYRTWYVIIFIPVLTFGMLVGAMLGMVMAFEDIYMGFAQAWEDTKEDNDRK